MKLCKLLILISLLNSLSFNSFAAVSKEDSLAATLTRTTNVEKRLQILQDLSRTTMDDPHGLHWLRLLEKEATKSHQRNMEDWTFRYLARHYYNEGLLDSIYYYAAKSDSLAKVMKKYTDYYYDTQSFLCQFMLWEGQMEKAADNAINMYNLAKDHKNENGIICSCETLGLINQKIGRDSVAVELFTEGMNLLEKKKDEYRYLTQFICNVIESELRLDRLASARRHLAFLKDHIDKIKNGYFGNDPLFPYSRCFVLLKSYDVILNVKLKNEKAARQSMDQAAPLINGLTDDYAKAYFLYSKAVYYMSVKQYDKALSEINKEIEMEQSFAPMKLRAEILYKMGNLKESVLQYRDLLKRNEEMYTTAFVRQMSQIHALHAMNALQLEVKELHVKELNLGVKQQQLKLTFTIIITLILLLIFGLIVYIHMHKLKNELLKEKSDLLKSEKDLCITRDQAEESNRMKSLFISNMSHEIRTPLNAIVGFTQLLDSEMEDNDERKEYARIITDNSELLLNLVNDILDLSRLESERYRFSFSDERLVDCCRSALNSVLHRVKPSVELKFHADDENFILKTDKIRLSQVLINLLTNATKFTEKGFIELAYTVHKEEGFVEFSITDTGCGIPQDKQDAIFERFEKLNEHVQGTGLGLSICRIIADRVNGKVYVDKDYTTGARFIFTHSLNIIV